MSSISRDLSICSDHWGKRQLATFRAVASAAPQRMIRVRQVCDPSTIKRKSGLVGGDAGEIWNELSGLRIITHKFAARLGADSEYLPAISTRSRSNVGQGAVSKPQGR